MAVTQKITITDKSGGTHATSEELMTKLAGDVSTLDSVTSKIVECTNDGTLVSSSTLTHGGRGVEIIRVWDDASWADFQSVAGAGDSDFSDAGWEVVSVEGGHPHLTTRQDDTFGE